jgi:glycerophosphoryl diester phosphodiesterase
MLQHFPSPIILAHRGDLAHAPENTLPSFSQAIQKGADGVELDAKLTSDGQVIVIHDTTVDRTTNGTGKVASLHWMPSVNWMQAHGSTRNLRVHKSPCWKKYSKPSAGTG